MASAMSATVCHKTAYHDLNTVKHYIRIANYTEIWL